jgi:predicted AAA+ superfamily ATPase
LLAYLLGINTTAQMQRDPLRGNLFENMVIMDFYKNRYNFGFEPSFYFHHESNEREVDLIFKVGNNLIPIEIKSSQTYNN